VTEQQIYDLIFSEEDLSWQSLLMEVVKQEDLDPWDIDVSKLVKGYIKSLKKIKHANLRISGKVILSAGLLLKVKSKRFVNEDMQKLERLFQNAEEAEMDDMDDFGDVDLLAQGKEKTEYPLYPRMPQPRRRKVSIYDLVDALDKAMKVRQRRVDRRMPYARQRIEIPDFQNVEGMIVTVYENIRNWFKKKKTKLTFEELLPDDDRESKVFTFIPLLHLNNERRIDLRQEEHFGDIEIRMVGRAAKA